MLPESFGHVARLTTELRGCNVEARGVSQRRSGVGSKERKCARVEERKKKKDKKLTAALTRESTEVTKASVNNMTKKRNRVDES